MIGIGIELGQMRSLPSRLYCRGFVSRKWQFSRLLGAGSGKRNCGCTVPDPIPHALEYDGFVGKRCEGDRDHSRGRQRQSRIDTIED